MEKFTKGELFTATLSPIEIEQFSDYFPKLAPVLNWKVYRGHIQDIYKITEEYQQEMVTLYLAGLIDANDKGELKPYDFLTKNEAEEWIEKVERYKGKGKNEAGKLMASTTTTQSLRSSITIPSASTVALLRLQSTSCLLVR